MVYRKVSSRARDLSFGKAGGRGQGFENRGSGIIIPRANGETGGCG